MGYKIMRLKKYYDALRTNRPFLRTSPNRKYKISINIFKFILTGLRKPLIINNKPVTAQIEPTSLCNLKCSICIREKIGVPLGTMKFNKFKDVLDRLNSLFKIHLSGQGEPFINKDLFKMIKYANQRGILVNLNTNGTLFTKENIQKIVGVEVGEIAISIESTNKKTYEKIRKGAKFEKVVKGITELNKKLKEKRKNTIVSFAVTILRKNIHELPEFVKLASKIGVKKLIIQTIQEKEDYVSKYGSEMKSQTTSDLKKEIEKEMKNAREIANKKNITLIFDEGKNIGCIWPWRNIYVTWEGYVTACCKILNYKEPFLGNLFEEDFWKIWNGKNYQMFRKLLRNRKAPLPCRGCSVV